MDLLRVSINGGVLCSHSLLLSLALLLGVLKTGTSLPYVCGAVHSLRASRASKLKCRVGTPSTVAQL